jgi:protein KIBRA
MNEIDFSEGAAAPVTIREESSDESTIISSQTSTLTRNQGQDELNTVMELIYDEENNEEDVETEEEEVEENGMIFLPLSPCGMIS